MFSFRINVKRKQDEIKRKEITNEIKRKEITNEINSTVQDALFQLNKFNNNPDLNNKKVLLLVATHTNSDLKKESIKSILKYFDYECIDIFIANSTNLEMTEMKKIYENKNIIYHEIDNDNTYDFGKWFFLLNTVNYKSYDDIIFINDSIILNNNVNHFINLTIINNYEFYGYNDSTQCNYHYQSYLFSIKPNSIYKKIDMFFHKKKKIKTQQDVIHEFELKMLNYFKTHCCFLKIGNISINKGKNIQWNDKLFNILYKDNLLPFLKVRYILSKNN